MDWVNLKIKYIDSLHFFSISIFFLIPREGLQAHLQIAGWLNKNLNLQANKARTSKPMEKIKAVVIAVWFKSTLKSTNV